MFSYQISLGEHHYHALLRSFTCYNGSSGSINSTVSFTAKKEEDVSPWPKICFVCPVIDISISSVIFVVLKNQLKL